MKLAVAVLFLLAYAPLGAQAPAVRDSATRSAFLFRFAFNPDWVLRQGTSVKLERAQVTRIQTEIELATADFSTVKQQLDAQQRELDRLLGMSRVDEAAALRSLDAVLQLESELKRLQLTLLIRTKNTLSPEQQKSLLEMGRTSQ